PGLVRSEPSPEGQTNLPSTTSMSRGYAEMQMMQMNRRPADQPIFAGGKAWVNRFDELVVVDLDTGNVLQRTPHSTNEQSRSGYRSAWGFDNRLNRAASAIGGRVYCVENHDAASPRGYAQTSGNVLAAYVADTGPLLWRVGRELPPAKPEKPSNHWRANAILFLAPPVPCAGLLLAPVEDENGLNVVGLDAEGGLPVWRTRVAYKRLSSSPNLAMLTVNGASAYLCNGRGQVTALDGCDGSVRWTSLYESSGDFSATNAVSKGANSETLWEENLVLVAGEAVVALPEDSGDILAFDRRNGTPLWRQRKPKGVDYVVGRQGAALIVAGGRSVACVDLTNGRERWRKPIAGSPGRGALCGTEVLIPCGQTILRLRVEDGTPLGSVRAQTMDDLPLGNLYVNGDQLLVAGLERLYALVDARPAFARLQASLAKAPTAEAYAERGGLYAGLGYPAEAVTDLREAWKLQRGAAGEATVRSSLLKALRRAAEQEPGAADKLGVEAQQIAGAAEERAEATWRLAQSREQAGNTNGALTLYVEMVAAPDATLSSASSGTSWKTSAHRAASQRIRTLLANDEPKYRALVEKPAAQALAG
ncbi:MAG: PQQ-binding-like beta-propeller repeat protein, partial [Kiritimatiellia bacterium]